MVHISLRNILKMKNKTGTLTNTKTPLKYVALTHQCPGQLMNSWKFRTNDKHRPKTRKCCKILLTNITLKPKQVESHSQLSPSLKLIFFFGKKPLNLFHPNLYHSYIIEHTLNMFGCIFKIFSMETWLY